MSEAKTLAEKVWEQHVVHREAGRSDLLYVDLHLIHEVTSPQAFEGLRMSGRQVRRPDLTVGTADHDVPTKDIDKPVADPVAARQLQVQVSNCQEFGIELHPLGSPGQGIVHVIGPQMGLTQPGMTIVCGDSHTATHGAFGAVAFGIGTSQVEHVLATQTLWMAKPGTMAVTVDGELPAGVTAKDLVLAIIARIGTDGGTGTILEFRGDAVRSLSMEGRMTVCNMAIEAGARAGLICPDETTYAYLEGRERAPQGAEWERALEYWRSLATEPDATFDREVRMDAATVGARVSWGVNPAQSVNVDGVVPDPAAFDDPAQRAVAERALVYQDLAPGTRMKDVAVDTVFIGSCTNGRLEDLRAAAAVLAGRTVAPTVNALAVPGSMQVKTDAEAEGLDEVFIKAGFEWRSPGCSMCLGMNDDRLGQGERSASTSNRNFEGRQGAGGRTHLVSPETAAATAVLGHFGAVTDLT